MKKKVLTVDDSRTIRNMLLVTLNNAGFETIQAEDGIEGLEVLEESNPDVIVTDINMPRLDGFGFIEGVRRNEKYRAIPTSWHSSLLPSVFPCPLVPDP